MIYFDNSATTVPYPEALRTYQEVATKIFGNPSSLHQLGTSATRILEASRKQVAELIGKSADEIFFTSGGTEGDNWVIKGVAFEKEPYGKHIIVSDIEHPAVKESAKWLSEHGFEVSYAPVNEQGFVDVEALAELLRPDTILVSVMAVNNEIGSIQPIQAISDLLANEPTISFHVDAVQAFGKFRIHPYKENIDMLTMSSHKIHGPKGVGAIFIKDKTKIQPIALGGGQQKGMRSGTENVPGIAGMAMAAKELYDKFDEDVNRLYELKEYFVREITGIEGATVNGLTGRDSAPHVVSVSFDGITKSEVLLHALEDKGIYISSGSACSSNKPSLSSTLKAIGVKNDLLYATLRFSFSVFTTKEELEYTINAVKELLPVLRKYRPR